MARSMSATRSTTWSSPLIRTAGLAAEAERLARVASSGMVRSFVGLALLGSRLGPGFAFGAGGAALVGAEDAVAVGVHFIEAVRGALLRQLDILVLRDVVAARGGRTRVG